MHQLKKIIRYSTPLPHPRKINATWVVRLFYVLVLVSLINPIASVQAGTSRQTVTNEQLAQDILNRLTPEERVGQLILVTFNGMDVGSNTQIYDLIIKMLNALMLSMNTFTTLGFGEIPIKGLPRYLAIIQGFIGWFMLTIFSVSLISQLLN